MTLVTDFYHQKHILPISTHTHTRENLDHLELGGHNGSRAPRLLYNLGPGWSPDNRLEFSTPAAEEEAEMRCLLITADSIMPPPLITLL